MTGIQLIEQERKKQIEKHGFTGEHHAEHPEWYSNGQLIGAAFLLKNEQSNGYYIQNKICPRNWDEDWFVNLLKRPYKERLIISGALIASEIDRLNILEDHAGNPTTKAADTN